MRGLKDIRVVDFSTDIAGPFATKMFVDAGAEVIKIEPPAGDPMRKWSGTGADLGASDGALFRFLAAGKKSVVGLPGDSHVRELVRDADLVVEDLPADDLGAAGLCAENPGLVVLSVTPCGRSGPYTDRPWTEFILQAESGSTAVRGRHEQEPVQAGARITDWVSGAYGAAGALGAVLRAQRTGQGEHVDLSRLEVINISAAVYLDLLYRVMGIRDFPWPARTQETPSIEPTANGWVGFNTNSRQQFDDFLVLIERPDLAEDDELASVAGRLARFDEWQDAVRAWTRAHTTEDIVTRASALRIPVAPVQDGKTVLEHEHFVAREVFVDDAEQSFKQPRRPYRVNGENPPPPGKAPSLGEHTGKIPPRPRSVVTPAKSGALPFAGLRVVDMTNWWAGPAGTHLLASLGADVIHLESIGRPDGARYTGGVIQGAVEQWWECSAIFLAADANKRSLSLDLNDARGKRLFEQLLQNSDLLVENYSPRVLDGFGFTWERLQELNPRLCAVRMPAFGLEGPWRDNVGFAQTMDQISGLAWVTGHADDQPRIQRGPCDPLAGMIAAFASMVAINERNHTGRGVHVESPMVEGALNAASEAVVEYTAYGNVMQRQGNRSVAAAPQGLYPCRGHSFEQEEWLALSVATDAQWEALVDVLDRPSWACDAGLAHLEGRRTQQDRIDDELRSFFAGQSLDEAVARLISVGIPAGRVWDTRRTSEHPQLVARGLYENVAHPIAGTHPTPTLPFRYASLERWTRSAAPTLGEHNREILCDLLGASAGEFAELERDGVVGTRPRGT